MDIIDKVLLVFSPTVEPWHDDVRRIGTARNAIATALSKLAVTEAGNPNPVGTSNSTSDSGVRFRRSAVLAEISAKVATLEPSFSQLTVKYVRERFNGNAVAFYTTAGMDRRHYSKIISNRSYATSKQTAIHATLAFRLSEAEAIAYLKSAGYAFSSSNAEDIVYLTCIRNGVYEIKNVESLLKEFCRERDEK
jgi:hypothetical protein